MVAMQFSCPHCGGLFQVDSSLGGQQVSCPHCRGVVALPAMAGHPQPGMPAQYPGGAGGGTPGYGGQEMPVRPPGQLPGFPPGGPGQGQAPPGHERPVRPAPGFPQQPQVPIRQVPPGGPAVGVPQQPQVPAGQERPMQGPQVQRPLRPTPLGSQPAVPTQVPGTQTGAGDKVRDQVADQGRGFGQPQGPTSAPTVPSGPATPGMPAAPRPRPGGAEQRIAGAPIPTAPGRPEVPLSSPAHLGGGMPAPGGGSPGAARLPMTGPQPAVAPRGGVESLLPPGPAGDAAAKTRGSGVGPQMPFSPPSSGAMRPPPAGGPARPIVLPAPDGGIVNRRDPVRTIGSGDDAIELRTRSGVRKETWRFKKNLIMWAVGLFVLGITIIILMILGPIRV